MGEWQFTGNTVKFLEAEAAWQAGAERIGIGVAASDVERFTEGIIEADVRFDNPGPPGGHSAGIILGFKSFNDQFYYVEFGDAAAYSVARYEPGFGFRPLMRNGLNHLQSARSYAIKAVLRGQLVELRVDGVKVAEATLPQQAPGHQVALIASGPTSVIFEHVKVTAAKPRAFVAMQFGEAYDRIWERVIRQTVLDEQLDPVRIDEVVGSTPILEDIKRHVAEAAVVIAEITSLNPNVFYEVGYADSLHKPLVLLAQNGTKLPFDVSGYRTVFYEDAIGGEALLSEKLRNHLRAII